ncbi:hypothetical protein [Microbispora sp. CA-102843]|uniref:hypothetical protein n=1 Tax=Microbispora sp. CA-102843 TaxID=3239952 RepID=UPI003D8F83C9
MEREQDAGLCRFENREPVEMVLDIGSTGDAARKEFSMAVPPIAATPVRGLASGER